VARLSSRDPHDQPIEITDANGGKKTITYTEDGQLKSHMDCSGKTST
jgi:YD repeat-containing protein